MSKHTPGPYFAGLDTGIDCPNHAGGGLAVIDTGREDDWPIARHVAWNNVPLLTASTELLDALKLCRYELAQLAGPRHDRANFAILSADAAIAKAEGKK